MSKRIIVVESSKTLTKVIKQTFSQEDDFDIIFFEKGISALDYFLNNTVDCIVSNVVLSDITGFQLSRLVKDGSKKYFVPVVLYQFDDDNYNLFSGKADYSLIQLDLDSMDYLIDEVNHSIQAFDDFEEDNSTEEKNKLDPVSCAVKAMDSYIINDLILKRIFELEYYAANIDMLMGEILKVLYEICSFDGAAIILNTDPAKIFYEINIDEASEDFNNFINISKSDFESFQDVSNSLDYEYFPYGNIFDEEQSDNFRSFKTVQINHPVFTGTIHIASSKKRAFNYSVASALDFFAKHIGLLISHSLEFTMQKLSQDRMYSAFTKFVPAEVIEDMIKNDDSINESTTEKRKVAILICDIRSFTTISEMNEPEDVVNFLNVYFTRMVDIIKQNGGSIDKFMGDAIMAIFGAPISYSDNAKRAVDAAKQMIEALHEVPTDMLTFNEKVQSINIGIGIHYGEVIVGNIGCKDKTDYTVIGDSANLASRLEGLTKQYGTGIIISRDVIEGIEDTVKKDNMGLELKEADRKIAVEKLLKTYNLVKLDCVKVKGKHKGIEIFSVNSPVYSDEYKEIYEKGLSLYLKGNFNYAREYFEKSKAMVMSDKASELLIDICNEYFLNPPTNWDGARELTSK